MTKSELKNGMVVTYRDGTKHMVYKDCFYAYRDKENISTASVLATKNGVWSDFSYINEDLTHGTSNKDLDIMIVEVVRHPRLLWMPYDPNNYITIWERNPPKKMTVAEIEAILGYRVEIVSEKEN